MNLLYRKPIKPNFSSKNNSRQDEIKLVNFSPWSAKELCIPWIRTLPKITVPKQVYNIPTMTKVATNDKKKRTSLASAIQSRWTVSGNIGDGAIKIAGSLATGLLGSRKWQFATSFNRQSHWELYFDSYLIILFYLLKEDARACIYCHQSYVKDRISSVCRWRNVIACDRSVGILREPWPWVHYWKPFYVNATNWKVETSYKAYFRELPWKKILTPGQTYQGGNETVLIHSRYIFFRKNKCYLQLDAVGSVFQWWSVLSDGPIFECTRDGLTDLLQCGHQFIFDQRRLEKWALSK